MTRERELMVLRACIRDLERAVGLDDAIGQVSPRHYRQRQEQLACLRAELVQLTHETKEVGR